MKKIIGTNSTGYNQKRNFINLPFEKYEFKKVHDFFKIPNRFYYKLARKTNPGFNFSFFDLELNKCSHLHFFNTLSFSKKPWIVTFEDTLPRWGKIGKKAEMKGIKLLAGNPCKKVIAFSESAFNNQILKLNEFPEYADLIKEKMLVLHPGQHLITQDYSEKYLTEDKVSFSFVGRDFFRKGGYEILKVFDNLLSKGAPIQLNIVSSLEYGDYASRSTQEELSGAISIISKHPLSIFHYPFLPNEEVIKLFKNSHIVLLPSYDETYGYVVLEAQAAGCPVITTDVRSFPEINNNQWGWIIEVPKRDTGKAYFNSVEHRNYLSKIIEKGLFEIIENILNDEGSIRSKGEKAIEQISLKHNLEEKAKILEKIYDEI